MWPSTPVAGRPSAQRIALEPPDRSARRSPCRQARRRLTSCCTRSLAPRRGDRDLRTVPNQDGPRLAVTREPLTGTRAPLPSPLPASRGERTGAGSEATVAWRTTLPDPLPASRGEGKQLG